MPSPAPEGTNQYRCNACGRYFNTEAEIRDHETQCRAAKMATEAGRESLAYEDSVKHPPNDADKRGAPGSGSGDR
jgi:hypothetical protein